MNPLARLVVALGVTQIVSWGSLFYAIGVLGPVMARELGVSEVFVFTSFTASLLVTGALSPLAGRLVDRRGGRTVLSAGSVISALAMALLCLASHPAVMVAGWLVAGVAMAVSLYDPAFATLSQHAGESFRKAVASLTLFGGFASTVFWPLSHLLMDAWGWRAAFGAYAGLHLLLCLPLHRLFVPARPPVDKAPLASSPASADAAPHGARLRWLTAAFAAATFIASVFAVHVVSLLTHGGLTPAQAVSLAMLVGPMQVAGRLVELGFAGRMGAVATGFAALALLVVAPIALAVVDGFGAAAILFVVAYGCGNGVFTIIRGTVPAELFGARGLGSVLGNLARAGLFARALAPAAFSGMLAIGFTQGGALASLAAIALLALACYAMAVRARNGVAPGRGA